MISFSEILKANILIVDDQEAHSSLLEQTLRGAGYVSLTTTNDPRTVCELYRKNRYALILLDLQMPGMDGFQVMDGLKAIETSGSLPVLVLTAQPDHKLRALKAGAQDFLSKPFDLAEVLMRVHNMLQVRLLHVEAQMRRTQAENSERGMRASELSYRRLFEAAQDGILILDVETGCITDVNPFLIHLLGFSHHEMVGKTVGELSPFKDIESNQVMLERLQRDGYVRYDDLPLETKNGRHIEVDFVCNVYQAGEKNVIQCNIRDITEQHLMEEALQESETKFRTLFQVANDAIFLLHNGGYVDCNAKGLERFGAARDQLIGQSPSRFSPLYQPDGRNSQEKSRELMKWALAGEPQFFEWVHQRLDGTQVYSDIGLSRFDLSGEPYLQSIARDITERKLAEEELRHSQQRLRLALEAAQLGDWELDLLTQTSIRSLRHDQIFGYAELLPEWSYPLFLKHVHPKDRDRVDQAFQESVATGRDLYIECRIIHADQAVHWIWVRGTVFKDKSGHSTHMIGMVGDITERKRAEEQNAEQAAFLDKARDAIFVRDMEGTILFWNKGAERIYGWTRQEVVGRNIGELFYTNPKKFKELNGLTINQGEWHGELQHLTRDRGEITVEARSTLIRDNEGQPKSVLGINTDITERKKIEVQFMRAQRMESIGTLAGGVAHDLNNILAPIMMSIDLLKLSTKDPQGKTILETIEVSAKRGSDIVRQVLSFARGLEGERTEVQPKHLLKDLETIIKDTFPKDIRLQFSVPNDTWTILGDPTQVHQIFLNLCVNARDAMPNGGSLKINVENCVLDEQYVATNIQAKAGRYVNISVTDSGTGMPPGIMDKIFEPFFTTKELNKGTGLGLSTVMAIVKSHEGIVNVYSEPGKGTTFNVYLPTMEISSDARKEQAEEASLPRGNGETILLVDDEASILIITSQTLQAFGYRVLTATDGAEAVAIYAQHRHEIAAVLTDIMMPIMDGPATIRALTKIDPGVKIIAASGLNANGDVAKVSGIGVKRFLTKPYTAGTLLKAMRAILDEA